MLERSSVLRNTVLALFALRDMVSSPLDRSRFRVERCDEVVKSTGTQSLRASKSRSAVRRKVMSHPGLMVSTSNSKPMSTLTGFLQLRFSQPLQQIVNRTPFRGVNHVKRHAIHRHIGLHPIRFLHNPKQNSLAL